MSVFNLFLHHSRPVFLDGY